MNLKNTMIYIMNKYWGKDSKIADLKRRITNSLFVIYFLARRKSKIIKFEIPSEVLMDKSAIDIPELINYYITLAEYTKLDYYDDVILSESTDIFWTKWATRYSTELRTILKLGWLTNEIRTKGIDNSLQLLQSDNGKYICHPGNSRLLVVTYICPQPIVTGFYVWDPDLDPDPFILNYPHRELKNLREITQLYKTKSNRFKIIFSKLAEKDNNPSCTNLAVNELLKFNDTFSLDFLTMFDNSHWENNIKGKLFFKDVISFDGNNCIFGGIKFVKCNNKWITYERFINLSQDYRNL